ncbi:ribokinase [Rhizobium laguerreae]|uniref:PfkB family carbohydrate kinase n=1 Tax=Rhizobium TaxID=379 RepID=UPI0014426BE8|nr:MULTISPECIES: PfkB family carbohydrate kinase [Rhizobium]MBY3115625.1 ribokinase [Rhizobium laguerreae]MBY3150273.1 ribokinase [Rhizobium laguerreae]MBY3246672.1 ribokinase [Rhizobium laguerreae]MBY3253115.1 ribokinase [Rhizobium laguerreae]MBY3279671.1 ribokinase [Rhizobium laguerreae]
MTTVPLVTVFGSLHYDIAVMGPARPRKGETVTGTSWHPKSGGKGGNQAVSSARTGIATSMIGAVADDEFGRFLIANLDRKNVDHTFVRRSASQSTGMSVAIFDAEGDYGAVIVSGSNLTLGDGDVAAARDLLDRTTLLVLQSEIPDAANVAAARAVKRAGGRVLINAAPARPLSSDLQPLIDILVVNAIEAEMLAGLPVVETLAGALEAAKRLASVFPEVVVTAGGVGVAFADRQGNEILIEAVRVVVESTHGAGDEFIGVLAAEIASGKTMNSALGKANIDAAKLVSTPEKDRV